MDIETEIRELKRRVGDLEGAVNVLTGQMRNVQPELSAVGDVARSMAARTEQLVQGIVNRIDTVNAQVWSLRDDLPGLLDEALTRVATKPKGDAM